MKAFNKYCAYFLLFAISFCIVPKEIFHLLHQHQETEDVTYAPQSNVAHIGAQHEHCKLLTLDFPGFYCQPFSENYIPVNPGSQLAIAIPFAFQGLQQSFFFLRAPPFVIG